MKIEIPVLNTSTEKFPEGTIASFTLSKDKARYYIATTYKYNYIESSDDGVITKDEWIKGRLLNDVEILKSKIDGVSIHWLEGNNQYALYLSTMSVEIKLFFDKYVPAKNLKDNIIKWLHT